MTTGSGSARARRTRRRAGAIVAVAGAIVPASRRSDWCREWDGELTYRIATLDRAGRLDARRGVVVQQARVHEREEQHGGEARGQERRPGHRRDELGAHGPGTGRRDLDVVVVAGHQVNGANPVADFLALFDAPPLDDLNRDRSVDQAEQVGQDVGVKPLARRAKIGGDPVARLPGPSDAPAAVLGGAMAHPAPTTVV